MIEVKPVTADLMADADAIFASSKGTEHCFCMWFIIPVRDYHAGGREANRRLFCDLVERSAAPVGLLAYLDGDVVGWCAVGPRSRYVRALRTPTYRDRDPSEDDDVWFVPCFYVHEDARRRGVSRALLEAAVDLARRNGATAIEGFPFAEGAYRTKDGMVGTESLFASCGFTVRARPSHARVIMRLELLPSRPSARRRP